MRRTGESRRRDLHSVWYTVRRRRFALVRYTGGFDLRVGRFYLKFLWNYHER